MTTTVQNEDTSGEPGQQATARATESAVTTYHVFQLVSVLLLGVGLRLLAIQTESLWIDELNTLAFSTRLTYVELVVDLPRVQPHLPLYYLAVKAWIDVTGLTGEAARGLSAVFSTGTLLAVYAFARDQYDHRTGLTASILVALSPHILFYGMFLRMYSLFPLLAVLSMHAFARHLQRPSRRTVAVYATVTTLLLYVHYFAWLIPASQLAVYAMTQTGRTRTRWIRSAFATVAVTGLPSAAVIALKLAGWTGLGSARQLSHITSPPDPPTFLAAQQELIVRGGTLPNAGNIPSVIVTLVPIVVVGIGVDHVYRRGEHATARRLLGAWYLLPITALVAASYLVKPVFAPKYLGFAAVGLYIAAARGLATFRTRHWQALTIVLALALLLPATITAGLPQTNEVEQASQHVAGHASADDLVVVNVHDIGEQSALQHYMEQADTDARVRFVTQPPSASSVAQMQASADTVWLVTSTHHPGADELRAASNQPDTTTTTLTTYRGVVIHRSTEAADTPEMIQ